VCERRTNRNMLADQTKPLSQRIACFEHASFWLNLHQVRAPPVSTLGWFVCDQPPGLRETHCWAWCDQVVPPEKQFTPSISSTLCLMHTAPLHLQLPPSLSSPRSPPAQPLPEGNF